MGVGPYNKEQIAHMNHGNNNTRPLTSKGEMQDLDPRFQQVVRASSAGETIGHENPPLVSPPMD